MPYFRGFRGHLRAKGADENPTDGLATLRSRLSAQRLRKGHSVPFNNAIHPGEPCGVNANSLQQNGLTLPANEDHPLKNVNWVIVPQYNIGGQHDGIAALVPIKMAPALYGFRGNAANLDLNRDFIKMDSRNAEAFVELLHAVNALMSLSIPIPQARR